MPCPHCQQALTPGGAAADVLFELCQRCGTIWLDFGARRPRLYTSVESQVARWEQNKRGSVRESAG